MPSSHAEARKRKDLDGLIKRQLTALGYKYRCLDWRQNAKYVDLQNEFAEIKRRVLARYNVGVDESFSRAFQHIHIEVS